MLGRARGTQWARAVTTPWERSQTHGIARHRARPTFDDHAPIDCKFIKTCKRKRVETDSQKANVEAWEAFGSASRPGAAHLCSIARKSATTSERVLHAERVELFALKCDTRRE